MLETRSYSLAELGTLSGFDRRTIVYYVQQGLLPRVGRRGPKTRYPAETLRRLQFIRGIRDLQTHGGLINITLGGIREALSAADPDEIRRLVEAGMPAGPVEALFSDPRPRPAPGQGPPPAPPRTPPATGPAPRVAALNLPASRRSYGLADASIRQRVASPEPTDRDEAGSPPPAAAAGEFHAEAPRPDAPAQPAATMSTVAVPQGLGELLRQLEIQSGLRRTRLSPGASEQWTEIPITGRVFLSVRGLSEHDVPLADAVARILKRALRDRQP